MSTPFKLKGWSPFTQKETETTETRSSYHREQRYFGPGGWAGPPSTKRVETTKKKELSKLGEAIRDKALARALVGGSDKAKQELLKIWRKKKKLGEKRDY